MELISEGFEQDQPSVVGSTVFDDRDTTGVAEAGHWQLLLSPGNYWLRQVSQAGLIATTPGGRAAGQPIALTSEPVENVDFGNFQRVTVSFELSAESVSEVQGSVRTTATLDRALPRDLTVPLARTGTATNPSDYTIPSGSTLTIPAGARSGELKIRLVDDGLFENVESLTARLDSAQNAVLSDLPGAALAHVVRIPIQDTLTEGNELIQLRLLNPNSGAVLQLDDSRTATVTLVDDDVPPVVAWQSQTQSANEFAGSVPITVTLSNPANVDVIVSLSVNGTATRDADYAIAGLDQRDRLLIAAGTTTATFSLNLRDDQSVENGETITVSFAAADGGNLPTLGERQLRLTINDDDVSAVANVFAGSSDLPADYWADQVYADLANRLREPGATLQLAAAPALEDIVRGVSSNSGTPLDESLIMGAAMLIAGGNQLIDDLLLIADVVNSLSGAFETTTFPGDVNSITVTGGAGVTLLSLDPSAIGALHIDGTAQLVVNLSTAGEAIVTRVGEQTAIQQGGTTLALPSALSLVINGTTGSDQVTLDFTNGNPIPVGGLSIHGGGGSDELRLRSSASDTLFQSSMHTFLTSDSGRIEFDTDGNGPIAASLIQYDTLTTVRDEVLVADRLFVGAGAEAISITDGAAASDDLQVMDSTQGAAVTIASPSVSLTIQSGDGDDTVTVTAMDAVFRAALSIAGQSGDDTVVINGGLLLGFDTSSGNIELRAEAISLGADLRTDAHSCRAANKGCLPMTLPDYLRLLDWTGRQLRRDKRGAIPSDVAPILQRWKITDDGWLQLVKEFSRMFRRAAGTPTTLAAEATRRGHRWLKGIGPSRATFA